MNFSHPALSEKKSSSAEPFPAIKGYVLYPSPEAPKNGFAQVKKGFVQDHFFSFARQGRVTLLC